MGWLEHEIQQAHYLHEFDSQEDNLMGKGVCKIMPKTCGPFIFAAMTCTAY